MEPSINHSLSEVRWNKDELQIFDIYEHNYCLEHSGISVSGMFAVHNKGLIWLTHAGNYRDLKVMTEV